MIVTGFYPFPPSVNVLLGNGDGSFQAAVVYDTGGAIPTSGVIADLNGDGPTDLVVANWYSGTLGVLLGNGGGTFQAVTTYSSGAASPDSVVAADVNGDGKLDLVAANCGNSQNGYGCGITDGVVSILAGSGDGAFQPSVNFSSGAFNAVSVAVADVNGDGKPDLIVGNQGGGSNGNGSIGVLLNNTPSLDTTPPVITVTATPKILWPPSGRMAPVTVSGTITDTGSGVKAGSAEFTVRDEFHLVQPHGKIVLDSAGNYSFTILLRASRKRGDPDGRQYTIQVSAIDNAGNRGTKRTRVRVPSHRGSHGEND
jgi:hypothetical protein